MPPLAMDTLVLLPWASINQHRKKALGAVAPRATL